MGRAGERDGDRERKKEKERKGKKKEVIEKGEERGG